VTFAPLVARYLKLEVRSEAPALVEIAARNANLALEAATRASTDVGGESLATLATDGDLGSRWASRQSDPQWIYVSFGEARPVNAVRLYWEGAYASSYRVEISDDALNWTPVFVEPNGDGGVDSITFPVQEAAYVRVFGVSRATTYGYSIWEFEVYGPPGVAVTAAVDTDALVAELEAAEGFAEAAHTASSWRTFESARATAQGLAEDPYVNQRTVDTATTELTEARESLVERGDPAQLQAVADAFAEVDFTQSYTAETVLALDAALLAAQGKLAPEAAADTVQADFDTAVAAVWKAYAALVAKPVQTPEVTRPVVVVPRPAPAKTDPTPPPTPAKAKPTVVAKLVAKKVKASKRAKVKVTVSAKGVKSPSGNLVVKVGKKSVKAKVSKGKATVTLPKLKRGKYTVKVQYLGSSAIAKKTVTVAAKLRIV
jgi:hypothetical protein